MNKRYQVFISSTFSDLKEERKDVMQAILECNCFPAGMEMFPALDIEQFEYIKQIIDNSDYYILIVAGRYGSLADDGVGYTEKEFDYAVEKGVPVLAFLRKDIGEIPLKDTDRDSAKENKLVAFREKIGKGRLIKYWDHISELKNIIKDSLRSAITEIPRKGWEKCDYIENDEKNVQNNFINKSAPLEYIAQNKKEILEVSVLDIIELLGDCDDSLDDETYELNLEAIIKSCNPSLEKITVVPVKLNKALEVMGLVENTGCWSDRFYTITLTEKGKDIYKNEVLKIKG